MNSKKNSCRGNYMRKYGIGISSMATERGSNFWPNCCINFTTKYFLTYDNILVEISRENVGMYYTLLHKGERGTQQQLLIAFK